MSGAEAGKLGSSGSQQQTADSSGSGPRTPDPGSRSLTPLLYGQSLEHILAQGYELDSKEARWLYWFREACNAAVQACCRQSKCGAVLMRASRVIPAWGQSPLFGGTLLGMGWNGPPRDDPAYQRCGMTQPSKAHPKADRTCCLHAEARALLAVPRTWIQDAVLYFARVDAAGNLLYSGRPYCTGCSKLALDLGVRTWVLWHEDGPREYDADEYNSLSHQYDLEEERARERGEGTAERSQVLGFSPEADRWQQTAPEPGRAGALDSVEQARRGM